MRIATILLIGESKSGKDTLINVLAKGKFTEKYKITQKGKTKFVIINKLLKSVSKKLDAVLPDPVLYPTKVIANDITLAVGFYIPFLKIDTINFINTSGHNLEDTEKWIAMDKPLLEKIKYSIMIYVFDASKFYTDKNIKLGIQHTINECKHKNKNSKVFKIKYLALGTRASEVEDIEKLEDEVKRMGIECRIFELKDIPIEKILEFIFKG